VRLGIAACHFHMGQLAAAGAAFERVLALDAHNPEALMGLAVIRLSGSNVQQVGW
jgi:Flp pilus assembly protein TadD